MKYLSVFLIFFSLTCFAQPDGWIQTDIGEGHLVICKQKKKVGIWSNARGEFLEEPHKGFVLHYPAVQFLVDIYPKKEEVKLYHYYQGAVQEFEVESDSTIFWFGNVFGKDWNTKLKVQEVPPNAEDWLGENMIITTENKEPDPDGESQFSFSFNKELLNITLFNQMDYKNPRRAIKSIQFPGEDSIDDNGYVLYYPRDTAIYYSGVFDTKQGKWVIPTKYRAINEWEGIYAAYYWPSVKTIDNYTYDAEVYDFYKLNKKSGLVPTQHMKTQSFAFPLDLWPFEGEEVWYDYDSIYIYHRGKKGVGMYEIPLRGKFHDALGYSLEWASTESHFNVKELFEPEYDYIVLSGNVNYHESPNRNKNLYVLAAKGDNVYDILFMCDEREYLGTGSDTLIEDVTINKYMELTPAYLWRSTTEKAEHIEKTGFIDHDNFLRIIPKNKTLDSAVHISPKYDRESYETESYYKAKHIGNDKMVIFSYEFENWQDRVPLIASDFSDSIDLEGNVVYYAPDPGNYATGLFDCKSSRWEIEPEMIGIFPGNGGYVIQRPIVNEYGILTDIVIDFMNADGTYEFKDKSREEFAKPAYNKYKIYNYNPDHVWPVDPYRNDKVYFKTDKGLGISDIFEVRGKIIKDPTEMLMYNNFSESILAIDGDTIDLTIYDATDMDLNRHHYRLAIEPGAGIKVFGCAIRNDNIKWMYLYDSPNLKYQFVHFTEDTTQWWQLNQNDRYKYAPVFERRAILAPERLSSKSGFGNYTIGQGEFEWEFKVEAFTEDLIYFEHNEAPGTYIKYELVSDESTLDQVFYNDSLDIEGNVVYEVKNPGFCHSGVWNRSTKSWLIPNEYKSVEYMSEKIFLLQKPLWEESGLLKGYAFSLFQDGKETELKRLDELDNQDQHFSIGKINDSLFFMNDIMKERADYRTVKSKIEPLMDSINNEGDMVYHPRIPGEYNSGVYNVYTDEWIIKNNVEEVALFDDALLVVYLILDNKGFVEERKYSLYDLNGELLIEKVAYQELPKKYR